ncbi:hypothetical protein DPMN_104565 [Dreissena polymorpha]|uniref:Uncharacterized protein n=1 Tax=Dreissena polymorpha TaxID=45954 RepID=A0A9D4HFU7_DREPO|nr:hypothetical protein DPMN_104565 [Dreissena polymorpha]
MIGSSTFRNLNDFLLQTSTSVPPIHAKTEPRASMGRTSTRARVLGDGKEPTVT